MSHDAPSLSLRRYGASPGSHSHTHFQLLWGWRGALELEVEGRGARMTAGRLAVIAPGDRHDFWAPRGSSCFVVDCGELPQLGRLAGRVVDAGPATLDLLRFLAAHPGLEAVQRGAAELLLSTLPAAPDAGRARRRIDWPALDAWIDAHLAEPVSVARLALLACLSPSQFAARCVEETGLAPMAYVRGRRLRQARGLRAQGWQVQQIASHCGYRSPSALTAALRRDADANRDA
ncbi:AraC family transcriptional regulator [Aquabacterium sp. A7-Y]|uniref:helix-turn-helix domain-containing protein n=1 Tax=Aquabacterium sp. A7-Y TaxID=1349605 RepID=UPI00223E867A|nr:AraC family transcriptional regulator [Aquabacterium sp. A7-Y]MCW7539112.1 AraC family transcriptional regulator [Aquabacterium sp. A7-Y]